jgi:L-ascorbate oxidase
MVNGFWPPPTIRVKAKDKIFLKAENHLIAVAFTIHLHGFDQVGTPWADGTSMFSTCPVPPDTKSSLQVFNAPDQPGTYLYHGHVGHAKVSGFTGLLIVEANEEKDVFYEETYNHVAELDLLLADSYHSPSLPLLSGLLQQTFRWVGDPQTILMNGQSYFNCKENDIYECTDVNSELCLSGVSGTGICGAGQPVYYNNLVHCDELYCQNRTTLDVQSDKTYLVHIANGGVSAMLNVAIQNHVMTVVELDGIPCKPLEVSSLDLHVGQRAGVLINTDQPKGVYWISAIVRGRSAVRKGGALLVYDGVSHNLNGQAGEEDPSRLELIASQPLWDDWAFMRAQQQAFESLVPQTMPSRDRVYRTFSFLNTQERFVPPSVNNLPKQGDASGIGIGTNLAETPQCKCKDGFLKWAIDRKTFLNPSTPLLHSMYWNVNKESESELENKGFYKLKKGKVYDIVLQNYPACNGACEVHPWHMHGHHFWHVGTFEGKYDPKVGYPSEGGGKHYRRDTINIVGGPKQDPTPPAGQNCTATIQPCGYTVIRFVADNPGAWSFHCHIDWHLVMGMAVAFYYEDLAKTAPPPDLSVYDVCGEVSPQVVVRRALKDAKNPKAKKNGKKPKRLRDLRGMDLTE